MSRLFSPITLAWAPLPILLVAMLTSLLGHRSATLPPVTRNPHLGRDGGARAWNPAERARRWKQFQSVQGKALEPSWNSEGALVGFRLKGRELRSHRRGSVSISSAKEKALGIARDLNELEGLAPDTAWQVSRESPAAAGFRLELRQIREGVLLLPSGKITLELDEMREASSLVAEVVSTLVVTGDRTLTLGAARDTVERQGEVTGAARFLADRGRPVIWVERRGSSLQGRRSFEFTVGGNQIVVDSENGLILSKTPAIH